MSIKVLQEAVQRVREENGRKGPKDEADINRTYLSKLETAATWAGLEIIGRLASVLEVEPAELLKLPPKRAKRR